MSRRAEDRPGPRGLLARALSDPLRLQLLEALAGGEATVSQLVSSTGSSQPNLSNHLAVLRECGLVRADRVGRQAVYRLAGPTVAGLVEALSPLAGPPPQRPGGRDDPRPLQAARTCYDHLAGRVGVAVFNALVAGGAIAIRPGDAGAARDARVGRDRGRVELGPRAQEVFGALGVELGEVRRQKRTFASFCIDWTERTPHLSGALGSALWARFLEDGWAVRIPGQRAVIITPRGRRVLSAVLSVRLRESSPAQR